MTYQDILVAGQLFNEVLALRWPVPVSLRLVRFTRQLEAHMSEYNAARDLLLDQHRPEGKTDEELKAMPPAPAFIAAIEELLAQPVDLKPITIELDVDASGNFSINNVVVDGTISASTLLQLEPIIVFVFKENTVNEQVEKS